MNNNYSKNLKRNNKSYAYKENKGYNSKNKSNDNKKDVRSGSYDPNMIAQKHNKSFNEEEKEEKKIIKKQNLKFPLALQDKKESKENKEKDSIQEKMQKII